jgi:hypothetical protein
VAWAAFFRRFAAWDFIAVSSLSRSRFRGFGHKNRNEQDATRVPEKDCNVSMG